MVNRDLVLAVLKRFNHQESDYSDVRVNDVILSQNIKSSPETKYLLKDICDDGYLEPFEEGNYTACKITRKGLEFLQNNI